MRSKPIFLYLALVVLSVATIAVPLFLRQMPLPLRLVAGATNLLAAFAVAMAIRQAGKPSENSKVQRSKP